jgi:hypothetical protein
LHREKSFRRARLQSFINRVAFKGHGDRRSFVSAGIIKLAIVHNGDRDYVSLAVRCDLEESERARSFAAFPARKLGLFVLNENQKETSQDDASRQPAV